MKNDWRDLAWFGGKPLFAEPRHVGCPNVGDRHKLFQRLEGVLDRKWLSNDGPLVQAFEKEVAREAGVHHAVAMSSGTSALELCLRALDLKGEVLLPSCTFVATAHAVLEAGLTPRFCDVDQGSANLSPQSVREAITPQTAAILGVHLFGVASHVDELQGLANDAQIPLIFDASHALGATYRGRRVGSMGRAEVFSFHATKFVNAFEGGAVVTHDEDLARSLRQLRNFGFDSSGEVCRWGTNAKMSEVAAAMGLTSLESQDEFLQVNQSHDRRYRKFLAGVEGLEWLHPVAKERSNHQYVVLRINRCGLERDTLMRLLTAENVFARRYFYPGVHRMEPYRTLSPAASLPVTEQLLSQTLCLPTGTGMSDEDVEQVCHLIRWILERSDSIRSRMSHPSSPKRRQIRDRVVAPAGAS